MNFQLLFCFLCCVFVGSAQTCDVVIHATEKQTGNGVPNAMVYVKSTDSKQLQGMTLTSGKVYFSLQENTAYTVELVHGYFATESLTFQTQKTCSDTLRKSIKLTPIKVKSIDEVTILAPGSTTVAFSSEKYSVSDFDVFPSGDLLLLLYPKTLAKGGELMVMNGKNNAPFSIPEAPKELIRDYRGNVHVICEKGVYGVYQAENTLQISTIDKAYYMKYIFPIVDTVDSKIYFSNFNALYPAFDYFGFDQRDSTYTKVMEIKDDLMMELYRSEFKWVDVRTKLWAFEKQRETGIDKEIWVGAAYFTQSIYYRELYAPLFSKNDTLYVFDYYKDKLFQFDSKGNPIDSVAIFHHYEPKKTGWKKKLLQDPSTQKVYAFFEKGGVCSIREVNLSSGELGPKITLEHPYVDKIAVINGGIYYIYRPYESAQKKFLYVTKLPYEATFDVKN